MSIINETHIQIENPVVWGMVPIFLNPLDPATAREQLDANYILGWRPLDGFTVTETEDGITAQYGDPEDEATDPPIRSLGKLIFRDETLYMLEHEWCALKHEGNWELSRMD